MVRHIGGDCMRLFRKKNSGSKELLINLSLFIAAIFSVLILTNREVSSEENCGECLNPLVELKPMRIGGNIPEYFKKYDVEFAKNYWSGWAWLFFKKKNPCADTYYILDLDGKLSRHGIEKGKAKYIVESYAIIEAGNGQVPVLHLSGWNGSEYSDKKPALIPRLGSIEIHHDLIALKNGEKYDFGTDVIDCVGEPPGDDFYGSSWGEKVVIDGETYVGNDGLFCGDWGPSDVAIGDINFEKGDIGITIRKKETPSDCFLDIDDYSEYPPHYKIEVKNIKNLFNESMPDKVKIALKADKGDIVNGEELDDWRVFSTSGGKIPEPVLYRPPQCKEAKTDNLRIAGVCDFHDGKPSIGKTRFAKKINNIQCYDVTVKVTREHYENGHRSKNYYLEDYEDSVSEQIQATLHMVFDHERIQSLGFGDEIMEIYSCRSHNLSFLYSFEYNSLSKNYWEEQVRINLSTGRAINRRGAWNYDFIENKSATVSDFKLDDSPEVLVLNIDKKTKKVKTAKFYRGYVNYTRTRVWTQKCKGESCSIGEKRWVDDTHERFFLRPSGERGENPLITFGDQIHYFGGELTEESQEDHIHIKDTFRWQITRKRVGK